MKDNLKEQLDYVIKHSQFYRKKFPESLPENSITNPFEEFPFTTKCELLADQEAFPPFGSNLCVDPSQIRRIHKTSGTTNKPLMIALTDADINMTVEVGSQCFRLSGLRNDDVVVHCLNYNMWAGGYTDHQSLEVAGAAVIPFGVGHTRELIEMILQVRPTAIHCTPSYLKKIESLLRSEFNLEPKDLKLRIGLFGGEPGMQNKDFRNAIEFLWGLKAMNANYGLSDVLSMFGAECQYQDGMHFMGKKYLLPELIDISTSKSVPIKAGAMGELVLTNLQKQSQPLIRYKTNDIIKILSAGDCPCKQNSFKFEIIGRSDDMFVIRGVNVFAGAIDKLILAEIEMLNGKYEVHLNRTDPIDQIRIILEVRNKYREQAEHIRAHLDKEFIQKLFIRPELELLSEGSLPFYESKSRNVFRTL